LTPAEELRFVLLALVPSACGVVVYLVVIARMLRRGRALRAASDSDTIAAAVLRQQSEQPRDDAWCVWGWRCICFGLGAWVTYDSGPLLRQLLVPALLLMPDAAFDWLVRKTRRRAA
jgi:hypothetical protein